jgi:hypothetical protein
MRFFLLSFSCYIMLTSVFAYFSIPGLNMAQALPSIWRMSFFEFFISFHLYQWLRFKYLNKTTPTIQKMDSFFGLFFIFALHLVLIQVMHSFNEPVPLNIIFAVFESFLQLVPNRVLFSIFGLLALFGGINLALETSQQQQEIPTF